MYLPNVLLQLTVVGFGVCLMASASPCILSKVVYRKICKSQSSDGARCRVIPIEMCLDKPNPRIVSSSPKTSTKNDCEIINIHKCDNGGKDCHTAEQLICDSMLNMDGKTITDAMARHLSMKHSMAAEPKTSTVRTPEPIIIHPFSRILLDADVKVKKIVLDEDRPISKILPDLPSAHFDNIRNILERKRKRDDVLERTHIISEPCQQHSDHNCSYYCTNKHKTICHQKLLEHCGVAVQDSRVELCFPVVYRMCSLKQKFGQVCDSAVSDVSVCDSIPSLVEEPFLYESCVVIPRVICVDNGSKACESKQVRICETFNQFRIVIGPRREVCRNETMSCASVIECVDVPDRMCGFEDVHDIVPAECHSETMETCHVIAEAECRYPAESGCPPTDVCVTKVP